MSPEKSRNIGLFRAFGVEVGKEFRDTDGDSSQEWDKAGGDTKE